MPPVHTIHFDPAGGALSVVLTAGQGAAGSYRLILAEHDGVTFVKPSPFKGQFRPDAPPGEHQLPGTAQDNDGRILDLIAAVGLMDATRAFAVHLTVRQGGTELGTVSDIGTDGGTGPTHVSDLLVVLSGVPAVMTLNASARALLAKPHPSRRAPSRSAVAAEVRKEAVALLDKPSGRKRRGAKKGGER